MPVLETVPPVVARPERLGLVIQLAPEHPAFRAYRPGNRVDPNALHRRQVEHHAAVVGAVARAL